MLNEFTYCPRLFHLEHVEGHWEDNHFTVEGRAAHRRVDRLGAVLDGPEPLPDEAEDSSGDDPPAIARSVSLESATLGIVAKLDLVSTAGDEAVPVETKRGKVPTNAERSWEPERVQLMAQGLLLREQGYRCDHGVLYFRGSRVRVDIPFTPALEQRTRELITAAHQARRATAWPAPLEDSPKCPGCSLAGICLPDETSVLRAAHPRSGSEPRRLFAARDDAVPLYVQEQGAQIGKSRETLVVRSKGEVLHRAKLKDVSQVVCCGSVSVTAQALHLLCERGIPVVHTSMGHWFYGTTAGLGLRNAYDRAAQFRAADDPGRRLEFARSVVASKIRNQRTMLRRNGTDVPERTLSGLAADADRAASCTALDSLLGIEGSAGARYFASFAGMLRSGEQIGAFDFEKRNRRPPRDPVNAMLSFAYAMLSKELTVALVAQGLDPHWGLYHAPRHGRPALALDLMEEFRPLIADSAVLAAINMRMVSPHQFEVARSGCAMKAPARKALIRAYESRLDQLVSHPVFGYRCSWRTIIRLQVQLFARWLRGDVPAYQGMTTR